MLNKYQIIFGGAASRIFPAYIYAQDEEAAERILRANFGPSTKVRLEYLRPATKPEMEAVGKTGSRSPRKRDG